MRDLFRNYFKDESGASALEYALFFTLIGLAIVGGANVFTDKMDNQWNFVDNTFKDSIDSSE